MANLAFESFKVGTDDGTLQYEYIFEPSTSGKTFLLLHGFPSRAADWHRQIHHLRANGHGVLAPNLLGYNHKNPTEPKSYSWTIICKHVDLLLFRVRVEQVIVVGHDLGSWMASRFVHLHPHRVLGLAFLNVGYSAPSDMPFDVDQINSMTEEMTGEAKFGYWDLLTAEDGVDLVDANPASLLSLMHSSPSAMVRHLGPIGATRDFVAAGQIAETGPWMSAEEFASTLAFFKSNSFRGPLNWYKALRANTSLAVEKTLSSDLTVPVLLIASGQDQMTVADLQKQLTEKWCRAGFEYTVLDAGHWVMLERAEEVNELLDGFARRI